LRNGSQYQTRQNARWFATLAEAVALAEKRLEMEVAARLGQEKAEGHAEDARQFFIKERELRLAAESQVEALRSQIQAMVHDHHVDRATQGG